MVRANSKGCLIVAKLFVTFTFRTDGDVIEFDSSLWAVNKIHHTIHGAYDRAYPVPTWASLFLWKVRNYDNFLLAVCNLARLFLILYQINWFPVSKVNLCVQIVKWRWVTTTTTGSYRAARADLDKSLDLEKFSKRNYSWFSLSSWRSEFSFLVLLSIFKIFRKHFSFSSRFPRFLYSISLSPLDVHNFV